jgi:hypothetical protein
MSLCWPHPVNSAADMRTHHVAGEDLRPPSTLTITPLLLLLLLSLPLPPPPPPLLLMLLLLLLQAEVCDLSERLSRARCMLPANQLHLIDAFRSLVRHAHIGFWSLFECKLCASAYSGLAMAIRSENQ